MRTQSGHVQNSPGGTLCKKTDASGKNRLEVKLTRGSVSGDIVERKLFRDDEVSTQYICIGDDANLKEFINGDPLVDVVDYRRILADASEQVMSPDASPAGIEDCRNEADLLALIKRIGYKAGASHCFYHWFTADEQTAAIRTHDLLVGGSGAWAQRYVRYSRHLGDPAVEHARRNSAPLRDSGISTLSDNHWFHRESELLGIKSHIFFPAHRRSHTMFGMLHIGVCQSSPDGDSLPWENRNTLRALAGDLLDWRIERHIRNLILDLGLTPTELTALRLTAHGGTARHVGEHLGLDERVIYALFQGIDRKMGCRNIRASTKKAAHLGILESGYIP